MRARWPARGEGTDFYLEEDAAAAKDIRRDVQRLHGRPGGGQSPGPGYRASAAAGRGRSRPAPRAPEPASRLDASAPAGERQIASLLALAEGNVPEIVWSSDETMLHAAMTLAFAPNFITGAVLQKNRRIAAFKYGRRADAR